MSGHPYEPTLAVSGLDNTIKIFSSDRRAQHDARHGVNLLNPEHPANMFGARPRNAAGSSQVFGLRSCKRIKNSYQIMSQNDIERQGGLSDAYITVRLVFSAFVTATNSSQRSMLVRLASQIGQRHTIGAENPAAAAAAADVGEGATLVVDENCTVSLVLANLSDCLLILHSRLCEYPATYIIHVSSRSYSEYISTTK